MGFFLTDLISGQQQADADNANAAFTSKLSSVNVNLDKRRAADALALGNYVAGQAKMRGSQLAGAQKNAFATSGVDVGKGTAAGLPLTSQAMSDMDAAIIQNNAARQAWGYKVQGLQDKWQGQAKMWGLQDAAQASLATAGIQATVDFATMFASYGASAGGGRSVGTSDMYGAGSDEAAANAIRGIR